MKAKFWKKLMIFLGLGFGAIAVASCQSTNPNDAVVVVDQPSVRIYEEKSGTESLYYATATVGVYNNSIYDVYTWNFDCTTENAAGTVKEVAWEQEMYVSHGSRGYVTFLQQLEDKTITKITINSVTRNKYLDVWSTYLWWWITGFIIIGVSCIGFAISVFSNRLTAAQTQAMFKEHTSTMFTILLFALILCIFPVFFGSWVSMLILFGSILSTFVINASITAIKASIDKKKLK